MKPKYQIDIRGGRLIIHELEKPRIIITFEDKHGVPHHLATIDSDGEKVYGDGT